MEVVEVEIERTIQAVGRHVWGTRKLENGGREGVNLRHLLQDVLATSTHAGGLAAAPVRVRP